MSEFSSDYPAVLEIDYPERERNALTTFFRPLTVIPIAIVLSLLSGPAVYADAEHAIAAGSGQRTVFFDAAETAEFGRAVEAMDLARAGGAATLVVLTYALPP